MNIEKYSFGIGDRFGMQGRAQLKALLRGRETGVKIVPVWNKSFREHQIIGTQPADVRVEADSSVAALGYEGPYYVDADHINAGNVENFIIHSDFFTLDVASYIGKPAPREQMDIAKSYLKKFSGKINIPGLDQPFFADDSTLDRILDIYLLAIQEAGSLYRKLCGAKGEDNFIAEVSMDEVEKPQSPPELFFILALIAQEGIRIQTIAPKFSGRFNKGVDYAGSVEDFAKEFEADLLVLKFAIREFGLPENLKLSIHSGSDKFSIYPVIGRLIMKHDMGIHVKTAGTTWLEEVIGLSLGDGEGLSLVKEIYGEALVRMDELCGPYADVIDIDRAALPSAVEVSGWTGQMLAGSLRHIPGHPNYNPNMRQLLHVTYKLAAEKGERFRASLITNSSLIARQVEENLFDRHIKRLFSN